MNRWAECLSEIPPTLHRLIVRSQRISLPRGPRPRPVAEPARATRARAPSAAPRTGFFPPPPAPPSGSPLVRVWLEE